MVVKRPTLQGEYPCPEVCGGRTRATIYRRLSEGLRPPAGASGSSGGGRGTYMPLHSNRRRVPAGKE